ncbi:MAG: heme biosynthesis HemY N-terminal domain-containing protein [Cellvibrionaceae bacterium]
MIRGFLLFVLFLVVGSFLYQLISQGSGYILIVWGKTSIEMSIWFAIFALIIILFSAWFIWALCSGSLRGVIAAKRKVFGYGDEKAQAKTVDGLIDFIEENWPLALRKLTRSAGKVQAPIINYLAAARSAYELGDEQGALELLHKAETSNERGGLAVAITQARMQLANKQYEQALATLERASAIRPEHPLVLSLRQEVYTALKDWSALKALLPQLNKNDIGSTAERHQLELQLHKEKLNEQIEKQRSLNEDEKKSNLAAIWSDIPNHLQHEESILSLYASQLMAFGEHDTAETLLASGLQKQWHGQWIDLYGLLLCENTTKPLKTAEKWLKEYSNSPNLLLALGRLCVQNQQWGRAVDFFKNSIALQPRADAYAELARMLDYMGETEKSIAYYKKGLMTSTSVLTNDAIYKQS